jgi:hypothetical protein
MSTKTITVADLEKAWGTKLSVFVSSKVKRLKPSYKALTQAERDAAVKKIIEFLLSNSFAYAGKHYYDQWEKGWGENLTEFNKKHSINALVPRYFGKYLINRFMGEFVMPTNRNYEIKMFSLLQYWIFDKYLKNFKHIYEFGCGTGHNLLRLREVNSTAELCGLDWANASQELIRGLAEALSDKKLKAHHFDFFSPDNNFKLDPKGALFTMTSLEQTGDRYKDFIDYILKNKPALCIHVEPTNETLNKESLLDYLSIEYAKKRKYLNGFIDYLKSLEKEKKIKIINIQRSYIGSFYIDGFSIIVWKPL